MRTVFAVILALTVATPAFAGLGITVIGPAPGGGTAIELSWEGTGTEFVTAQNWMIEGAIYNYDYNGPAFGLGLLSQPPKVQLASETGVADGLGANAPAPGNYANSDSYWGNYWASSLLGSGITGGDNNPGAGNTVMALEGGTNFSQQPAASQLLAHLVIAQPVLFMGEFAVGTDTVESYGGFLQLDGTVLPKPEPGSLTLLGLCTMGLVLRRRRR